MDIALPPPRKRGRPPKPKTPPTPEELAKEAELWESRVEYVADLMRELKFVPGKTTYALADAFGISYRKVSKICREAGQRVRKELEEHGPLLAVGFRSLYWVVEDAINSGDRHSVVKAVALLAQLAGAGAAQRIQVSPDLSTLTQEQLQARKAELIARLSGGAVVAALPPAGDE